MVARFVTFYVRQATKRKHNDLGLTTGPNYEGQLDVIELAGWRQSIPLPESSCFPGAGWRTTSLTQARLPAIKRLMIVISIPLIARPRAKACKGLADQLKTFIVTDESA